jgi:hypothetical protein
MILVCQISATARRDVRHSRVNPDCRVSAALTPRRPPLQQLSTGKEGLLREKEDGQIEMDRVEF